MTKPNLKQNKILTAIKKILITNSKGGCTKSTNARELICALQKMTMIEVDSMNQTHGKFKDIFEDYIVIDNVNLKELYKQLILNEHAVIDLGIGDFKETFKLMIEENLLEEIDKVVIPLTANGDDKNAIITYNALKDHHDNIIFSFNMIDETKKIEDQFEGFFKNIGNVYPDFNLDDHVVVPYSQIFVDAKNAGKTVIDYHDDSLTRDDAKKALLADDDEVEYERIMNQIADNKLTKVLIEEYITPAHNKILEIE